MCAAMERAAVSETLSIAAHMKDAFIVHEVAEDRIGRTSPSAPSVAYSF
jgi:hypothetical protein